VRVSVTRLGREEPASATRGRRVGGRGPPHHRSGAVPTVNVYAAELVSARLRNYQYHPVWGFIARAAWVR